MAFPFRDEFGGASGTRIDSRATDSGHYWSTNEFWILSGTGRAYLDDQQSPGSIFALDTDGVTLLELPQNFDLDLAVRSSYTGTYYGVNAEFCYQDSDNYYSVGGFSASTGTLKKTVAGVQTELASWTDESVDEMVHEIQVRDTTITVLLGGVEVASVTDTDVARSGGQLSMSSYRNSSSGYAVDRIQVTEVASGPDYTARKGATGVEITHTLTADGITSATLNGEGVTLASQAGQVATLNLDESAITTSGEYDLVLGDGVGTQTFTVQYNVIGISSKNLNKDGLDLASLDNLEIIVATLGGLQLARYTNKLTTPQGDTGTVLVNTGSALDMVNVSFISGDLNYTQKTELEVI